MLGMIARIILALVVAFLVTGLVGERLGANDALLNPELLPDFLMRVVERGWAQTQLAWPFAVLAIAVAEMLGIRALVYYLGAGALAAIAAVSFDFEMGRFDLGSDWLPKLGDGWLPRWRDGVLTTGVLGGLTYWLVHGHRVGWRGRQTEALYDRRLEALMGPSTVDRDRCRACGWLALLIGLVPVAMLGLGLLQDDDDTTNVINKAERRGTTALAVAGYPWATLSINNEVGEIIGKAPDAATRTAAFSKANQVLASLTGATGVVQRLDDRMTVEPPRPPTTPATPSAKEAPRATAEAEAKRKADEAARKRTAEADAKKKADEETRRLVVEAETKRKADEARRLTAEAEAKRKADEDARRIAAETEAKRKADEDARRIAAEAEAKRKADEDARRIAAEAEAKRKADEDARRIAAEAEAKRKADEETRRLAAEAETRRKADDDARRLVAEAEAKQKADAAKRTAAATAAAQTEQPPTKAVTPPSQPAAAAPALSATAAPTTCPAEQLAVLRETLILFAPRRAALSGDDGGKLDKLAAVLQGCADVTLRVAGHADRAEDRARTLALSRQRAALIVSELGRRGVAKDRLEPVGYGALRQPEASATTPSRRVEFAALPAKSAAGTAGAQRDACSSALASARIQFGTALHRPGSQNAQLLDKVAATALDCRTPEIIVEGHTDVIGGAALNERLSRRRAMAVRRALIARGVPANMLSVAALGATRPLDAATTPAAHAANRRVELVLKQ